jgi:triacylglycerol lipase
MPCSGSYINSSEKSYPYVFIPGMVGWGADYEHYDKIPYWGGGFNLGQTDSILSVLENIGIEAYASNPGPFNSAWDRACEVYAALTGTVVDYGKAHSEKHNHDRFGFSYVGKALMGEPWNMQDKINLLGYSFGTEVARLLTSLLAFGDENEIKATGDDSSELFKGGHNSINACITLSAPHNGTPLANVLVDTKVPMMFIATMFHLAGCIIGNNIGPVSLQIGHFGITPKQGQKRAEFSLSKLYNYYNSQDNCGYDMTLRGAKELNKIIKMSPDTYYYSFSTYSTVTNEETGKQNIVGNTNWMFRPTSLILQGLEGLVIDGVRLTGDWAIHDGVIPLASSKYPAVDEAFAKSYEEVITAKEKIEKGIWYYMEPIFKMDHFDFCGIEDFPTTMEDFYFELIDIVNKNS